MPGYDFRMRISNGLDAAKRHGDYNLIVEHRELKTVADFGRPVQWNYTLESPTGVPVAKKNFRDWRDAVRAAMRTLPEGVERVWVIIRVWDLDLDQLVIEKTFWQRVLGN